MTMYLGARAVVMVVGLVVYALANGKPMELGRLMFGCGLLTLLWGLR